MQDNQYSLSQKKQEEGSPDYLKILYEENKKLLVENAELKKNLEREELLHKNLYRQWTELNARNLIKDRDLKKLNLKSGFFANFYKYSFYALLLITVVCAWYLFSTGNKNSASLQTLPATTDTTLRNTVKVQGLQSSSEKSIMSEKKDTIPSKPTAALNNESSKIKTQETGKNLRYRVRIKTFFYNKPNENTQRNIFLLPSEGTYGVITAINDQNGFIYIVFKNHAGRTSKGWIRKTDLDPVN